MSDTPENQPHSNYDVAIYAVYDNKAKEFPGRMLHLHRHEATAMRDFYELCTDPKMPMNRHPDDFELVRLGYVHHEGRTITADPTIVTTARRVLDLVAANNAAREGQS